MEKVNEIEPRKTPLPPTIRAEGGRRDLHFSVEIKVLGLDDEIEFTVLTNFLFFIHGFLSRLLRDPRFY